MSEPFTILYSSGRTAAVIEGLAPAGAPSGPPPFILPVFIPQSGCPHQCSFCNQNAITGVRSRPVSTTAVEHSVRTWLPRVQDKNRPVQIAFYGGNFLGLPNRQVKELLTAATAFIRNGDAGGIRFSTRPDTITPETLDTIRDFPVDVIELGLQSINDQVLAENRRGHTAACTFEAARRIKSAGYVLGLQMMTGLPGDTLRGAEQTADAMIRMAPDAVRIYPTLVLKDSPLAQRFRKGTFTPMKLEETTNLVSRLFLKFASAGIPVIRMGLQADDMLAKKDTILAGPYHPALGELVHSRIFFNLAATALARHPDLQSPVQIYVHPRHLSRMIGAGRQNQNRLQTLFRLASLTIHPDASIAPHHLEVDNAPGPIASRAYLF
jgi:histone acetyltransferase (RNA polymerase elongator complex component)